MKAKYYNVLNGFSIYTIILSRVNSNNNLVHNLFFAISLAYTIKSLTSFLGLIEKTGKTNVHVGNGYADKISSHVYSR